jgi:hypothetical protein
MGWNARGRGRASRQDVDRISAYLTGRKQLAGSALALFGGALTLADPVGPGGVFLIAGFYLLGVIAVPNPRRGAGDGLDAGRVSAGISDLVVAVSDRVPPQVIARLQRIEFTVREEILPRVDAIPPGALDRYLIERTARDYLPTAVNAYLRLPAGYVSADPGSRGWSALQVLLDELDLLEAEMRRIAAMLDRVDMDRLVAHRRFLRDRFNRADVSG